MEKLSGDKENKIVVLVGNGFDIQILKHFKSTIDTSYPSFYNFLIEILKKDQNVKKIEKGMVFKKSLKSKFSQKVESEVKIIELIENKEYSLSYVTSLGENVVKYKIEEIYSENIFVIFILFIK